MKEIAKAYNHEEFEDRIYKNWEESGYFKPEFGKNLSYDRQKDGNPFVIVMPPPNVTGKLHIGHSLVLTIEDIMTRFHRLIGEPTLWLPGMDHAGIATQTVVDKALKKQGINKNEIGREKFVEKVWQWKEQYGGIILKQTRKMGASCDWSRKRFTLDEGLSKSVREAFTALYNRGLIYRGEYIVNWCPKCGTAIADDEVVHEEQDANLYYFKYDKNFPITIATTRPETKFGDTGVAVNPEDKRYKSFIGKEFEVNLDSVKRTIKVFADRNVDPKFGTGAVGVTPAHSGVDWKMAQTNKLSIIAVIDKYGKMTSEAGKKYQGLKAKEAGQKLVEYLKENNLLEKVEAFNNNLSVCYRCGSAIEPQPSLQWFVKIRPLAEKAIKAVKSGQIKIIPKRFEKNYFHWMENIPDWCISRQLWWGHRLPVYYPKKSEIQISKSETNQNDQMSNDKMNDKWQMENDKLNIYVGINPPQDIENWEQDEDVLDTWFSSALWPFSTLGWPEKTPDFEYFYPTTVLETAYDILPFWVNRMIMMGLELTGKVPFDTVYLHGMVRDEKNRKMSKSLGNALDPLDLISKYGTDALRMALVVGSTPGQDMAVGETKIQGYRNFSNKIWNASRFVILRVTNGDLQSGKIGEEKLTDLEIDKNILSSADKKVLQNHTDVIVSVSKKLEQYKFSQAGEELYEYFWHNFCDKYIEVAKAQLQPEMDHEQNEPRNIRAQTNTKKILIKILSESLIMLHPFVPFVTEAVWQELRKIYPDLAKSIMISRWPE